MADLNHVEAAGALPVQGGQARRLNPFAQAYSPPPPQPPPMPPMVQTRPIISQYRPRPPQPPPPPPPMHHPRPIHYRAPPIHNQLQLPPMHHLGPIRPHFRPLPLPYYHPALPPFLMYGQHEQQLLLQQEQQQREIENLETGRQGEEIADDYLRDKHPGDRVVWKNRYGESWESLDFYVVRESLPDLYYEVKSTMLQPERDWFFKWSITEQKTAEGLGDRYTILRVSLRKPPGENVEEFPNPLQLLQTGVLERLAGNEELTRHRSFVERG